MMDPTPQKEHYEIVQKIGDVVETAIKEWQQSFENAEGDHPNITDYIENKEVLEDLIDEVAGDVCHATAKLLASECANAKDCVIEIGTKISIPQAVAHERKRCADIVRSWHIKKGGYETLAHELENGK